MNLNTKSLERSMALGSKFAELYTDADIPLDDGIWQSLLNSPIESAHTLYSFLSNTEIRKLRDQHPENFERLLNFLGTTLSNLTKLSAVGQSTENALLSTIRFLTRILPVAYEAKNSDQARWRNQFFWGSTSTSDTHPLGHRLIRVSSILLHYEGFTLPHNPPAQIWQPGIGSAVSVAATDAHLANRVEVLRLLLTILSDTMYGSVRSLDFFVNDVEQSASIQILCSLLNTAARSSTAIWKRVVNQALVPENHRYLPQLCTQAVVILVSHLPMDKSKRNRFRMLVSKIHRQDDLLFLSDHFLERLDSGPLRTEVAALLWELLQANVEFRTFMTIDTAASTRLCELLVRKIQENRYKPENDNAVRIMTYVLLMLSSIPGWPQKFGSEYLLPIYTPFHKFNVHILVLLDIFYNISPYLRFTNETSRMFLAFLDSLLLCSDMGSSERKEGAMRTVTLGVLSTLTAQAAQNRPLKTALAGADMGRKLKSGDLTRVLDDAGPSAGPSAISAVKHVPIAFTWTEPSITWYQSVLWGRVYQSETDRPGVGVWNNTSVTLFKLESSPTAPRNEGPVDAVVTAVYNRIFGAARGEKRDSERERERDV